MDIKQDYKATRLKNLRSRKTFAYRKKFLAVLFIGFMTFHLPIKMTKTKAVQMYSFFSFYGICPYFSIMIVNVISPTVIRTINLNRLEKEECRNSSIVGSKSVEESGTHFHNKEIIEINDPGHLFLSIGIFKERNKVP